ncbi:elongin-A isoform X3 [Narcine bancroftii]|uniref:elongin-A isoform X3 n=1 Tax=Narcine bancroftii TaxID=1343680 RepID=UPI0038319E84
MQPNSRRPHCTTAPEYPIDRKIWMWRNLCSSGEDHRGPRCSPHTKGCTRFSGGQLLKTLKRLNELPVTVDILAVSYDLFQEIGWHQNVVMDTGIGKTVNGFRKHDVIGERAKNLVSKWKKLVPQEVERSTNTLEEREFSYNKGVSKKQHRELSPEDYRQTFQTPHGESYESNYVPVKGRRLLESEKTYTYSSHGYQSSKSHSKEHVERWTKSPPMEDYDDKIDSSDEDAEQPMEPPKSFHKTHQDHYGSRAEMGMGRNKEHKSSHKEKQHSVLKGEEKYKLSSLQTQDKMNQSCSKEQYNHRDQEDTSVTSSHKKPRLQTEQNLDDRKHKHKSSDKWKSDHDEQRNTLDKPKEKTISSKQKEDVESKKSKSSEKIQTLQKDPTNVVAVDEFEQPTMSFESYLSYDQPQKRKKKVSKPVARKVKETRQLKLRGSDKPLSKSGSKSSNSSYDEQNVEEKKKAKRHAKDVPHVKSKKMMIDVVPVLPDIQLPLIQPHYRPLPSMDFTPLSPPKRKAVSILSEEDLGFTGRRFNSKMQVYSGSKIVYLPKMMSLFEQCIRVLQNNVDSIHEVGGVPFEILEPVLERCTPDQLYRIENCNPVFVEETDHLWLRHCQRDFKNQDRQEFESWREMYLRLHDEREQKLRAITQSISSAHASKPKGRQAKLAFLNTEVKPPRDVRRRQERHGTGMSIPAPPRIKMHSNSGSGGGNQSFDSPGPSTSHGSSASSLTTPNSGGGVYESKKPQVKKIAPMMAKTIKFFKNRFNRR